MRLRVILVVVLLVVGLVLLITRKPSHVEPSSVSASAEAQAERAAPSDPPPAASTTSDEVKPGDATVDLNRLQVIVQDEVGRALERAEVLVSIKGEKGSPSLTNFNGTLSTGVGGTATVSWPAQKLEQLALTVTKDDFASLKMVWDIPTGDVIPSDYTVKLKRAVHVGGFVVDPEGNPVSGATVSLFRFWRGGEERKQKGEEPWFARQKFITEADGRWAARNLPSELLDRIYVEAAHTNFIGVQVSMDGKPEVEKELREGIYKLVLKRGLDVRGRVVDEQQAPIANAKVWAGRRFGRDRQETRSDREGRFIFRNINEGNVLFSVMADGYAPDSKSHPVKAVTDEILFQLAKGNAIRGIVQTEATEPIEGVRVVLEGKPGEATYDHYEFSTVTGNDGRFEWTSAPNTPVPFYFGKTGFEQRRGVRLTPGQDNVVTLNRYRQVQGQVLDAETGQPIKHFSMAIGRGSGTERFYADSQNWKQFSNDQGLFTMAVHDESLTAIQGSADGYAEQVQPLSKGQDGQVQVIFKLKPAKSLEAVLVTPDGQPVSGASVACVDDVPGGKSVQLASGRLRTSNSQTKLLTTDESGHFSIPSPGENGIVVAANGVGFASAPIAEVRASGRLTLLLFGRIEGSLIKGAEPGGGQELQLNSQNVWVSFQGETSRVTTDAEGRFVFEKIPAGTVSIVRLVKTSAQSWSHSHRAEVVVAPAQTTTVTLGGVDATLRGQVRFETDPQEKELILTALLNLPVPQAMTPEERTAYLKSPERKELIKNLRNYSAAVSPDGSLVLDSVAPGQYTLRVTASRSDDDPMNRKPIAQGQTTVIVPVGTGPGSPIEIGEVVLKPVANPPSRR